MERDRENSSGCSMFSRCKEPCARANRFLDKVYSGISLAGDRSAALHYLAGEKAVSSKRAHSGTLFYSSCHHNTEWIEWVLVGSPSFFLPLLPFFPQCHPRLPRPARPLKVTSVTSLECFPRGSCFKYRCRYLTYISTPPKPYKVTSH